MGFKKRMLAVALGAGTLSCKTPDATAASAVEQPSSEARSPAEKESLERLRALQIFEVGSMVLNLPEEAFKCYGPCPDWVPRINEEKARQTARLQALAKVASAATGTVSEASATDEVIAANLAALGALKIVEVGALLLAIPQPSPSCYGNPCAEDLASAKVTDQARAAKLAEIVALAKDL